MKQRIQIAAFSCILFCFSVAYSQPPKNASDSKIVVDLNSPGARIPTSMYGIFFEEINHSGDGGLCAELIQKIRQWFKDGYNMQIQARKLLPVWGLNVNLVLCQIR